MFSANASFLPYYHRSVRGLGARIGDTFLCSALLRLSGRVSEPSKSRWYASSYLFPIVGLLVSKSAKRHLHGRSRFSLYRNGQKQSLVHTVTQQESSIITCIRCLPTSRRHRMKKGSIETRKGDLPSCIDCVVSCSCGPSRSLSPLSYITKSVDLIVIHLARSLF